MKRQADSADRSTNMLLEGVPFPVLRGWQRPLPPPLPQTVSAAGLPTGRGCQHSPVRNAGGERAAAQAASVEDEPQRKC